MNNLKMQIKFDHICICGNIMSLMIFYKKYSKDRIFQINYFYFNLFFTSSFYNFQNYHPIFFGYLVISIIRIKIYLYGKLVVEPAAPLACISG